MTKAITRLEDLIIREPYPNSKLNFKETFDRVIEFRKGEGRDIDILNELFSACQEKYPSKRERSHSSKTKYDNMSPETRVFESTGQYLNGEIGYDLAIKEDAYFNYAKLSYQLELPFDNSLLLFYTLVIL